MSNNPPVSTATIEQTLRRLASQFTVRDIMVPVDKLVIAKTPENAYHLIEKHDDYNLIPIETEGKITGYIERNNLDLKLINLDVVVGIGCSIIDIVDVFSERQFCFVLGKWGIEGYIHFSDLNHHLVDLPFYILLQAVESHVISLIRSHHEVDDLHKFESDLHKVFDKKNTNIVRTIVGKFKTNKLNDANRLLLNEMNFDKMLDFASHFGLLELKDEEIMELYKVRNSLAHITERLVQTHDDVKRLVWTTRQCQKILLS